MGSVAWMVPLVICLLLALRMILADERPATPEDDLLKELFLRYEKQAKPPGNENSAVFVDTSFTLVDYEMEENPDVLAANMWLMESWNDSRLVWDPSEHGNISTLRLDANNIWKPDFCHYNSYVEEAEDFADITYPPVLLYSSGRLLLVARAVYKNRCSLTTTDAGHTKTPSHKAEGLHMAFCHFKFGSWTYDSNIIVFSLGEAKAELNDEVDRQWTVADVKGNKVTKYYPCCEEPYDSLYFNVTLLSTSAQENNEV